MFKQLCLYTIDILLKTARVGADVHGCDVAVRRSNFQTRS